MEPWDVTLSFWSSSLPASPSIPPLLSTSSTTTCITSTISAFCISFRINISYHWHRLFKSDILQSSGSDSGCTSNYTKDPSKYFEWKYPIEIPHCVVRLSKLSGVSNSTRWWESGCLQNNAPQLQWRLVKPSWLRQELKIVLERSARLNLDGD